MLWLRRFMDLSFFVMSALSFEKFIEPCSSARLALRAIGQSDRYHVRNAVAVPRESNNVSGRKVPNLVCQLEFTVTQHLGCSKALASDPAAVNQFISSRVQRARGVEHRKQVVARLSVF